MIIQPIKISGRITELLSKREVYICPKGFASILYKGKYVYNINDQYEFYEDKYYYAPNDCSLFKDGEDELRFKNQELIVSVFEKLNNSRSDSKINKKINNPKIISPKKISSNIPLLLSERRLYLCPRGYAAILYKDKYVYNVNEQYEFSEDQHFFEPSACRLFEMGKDNLRFKNQEILVAVFEKINFDTSKDEKNKKIKDFPSNSYLSTLAHLGIDNSVVVINSIKEKIRKKNYLKTVLTFRSRYESIIKQTSIDDISSQIDDFKTINSFLLKLPFKFFLRPIGKGKFLHIKDNIDRLITNDDVLKLLNSNTKLPDWANEVSEFKSQALSTLIFHSQIINGTQKFKEEFGVLDYVFEKKISKNDLETILSALLLQDKSGFFDLLNKSEILIVAMNNLTIDLIRQTSKWQNISFEQIYKLTSELPRKLKISKERTALDNPNYPREILGLSVYILSSSTENRNIISKVETLHRLGLRRIQDLILFHTDCRQIFKNTNFIKKVKNLIKD